MVVAADLAVADSNVAEEMNATLNLHEWRHLMTRIMMAGILAVSLTTVCYAQPRIPGGYRPSRPVTSPYLNLLRGNGRSTAFNYFRSVRPELEFRRNAASFSRSINSLQQNAANQQQLLIQGGGLQGTGHAATFQNLGGYFPGLGGGNSGFGLRGGGGGIRRQSGGARSGGARRSTTPQNSTQRR